MLTFGIMGAGAIANSFYESIKVVQGAELVAVASKSLERAKKWAKGRELNCYGDYEQMLLDERINAVYIATTVNYHYENIKQCLEHGKHVLCEKAMVQTEEQAKELFTLAEEKGLFLMEGMWSRFLPRTEVIRQWIKQDKIGKVQFLESTVGFVAPKDPKGRLYNPELGGGALYDIGVYPIDMMTYFADSNIVETTGVVKFADTGIDEHVQLTMKLENGAVATAQISLDAKMPEDVYIYGSKGYIMAPKVHYGWDAFLYDIDGELVEHFTIEERPGFSYEIEEMVRCVEAGKLTSDVASKEMTLTSSRIYDQFLQQKSPS